MTNLRPSRLWSLLPLLLLAALPARAYEFRLSDGSNTVALAAGESFSREALMAGYSVEMDGTASRDLWLLASTSLRSAGTVSGDLRALAAAAILDGKYQQNLLASARALQLTTNATVRGDVALFGNTVICEGTVDGDAWLFGSRITLGGTWSGNVHVYANELRVVPGTAISGDLIYTCSNPLVLPTDVRVSGSVTQRAIPAAPRTSFKSRLYLHGFLFAAALLAGMPFVGFFPMLAGGAIRHLRTSPWKVLFTGAAVVMLGPLVIVFILLTVIGLPLALLLGALWLILAYLSHIVVALWLGHLIFRSTGPQTFARVLSTLALGLAIFYAATALPALTSFILMPVVVLGMGSLTLALLRQPIFTLARQPRPEPPASN